MKYQHGIDTNPKVIRGGFKDVIAVSKDRKSWAPKSKATEEHDLFEISSKNFAGTSATYYSDVSGKREYFTVQK